jgi:hypothetical protein
MGRPGPQPQADIPNAGGTASRISPKPLDQWEKNPTGVSLRSWAFRTANYLAVRSCWDRGNKALPRDGHAQNGRKPKPITSEMLTHPTGATSNTNVCYTDNRLQGAGRTQPVLQ